MGSSSAKDQHLDLNSFRHDSPNGKASPSVEKEVTKDLMAKLEQERSSAFASIQQLHTDLDNKKTVIQNLTKRVDIGAVPTYDKKRKKDGQEISQLQLLMEETSLQNAMLRDQLKTMASQLMDSHSKINSLQQDQE